MAQVELPGPNRYSGFYGKSRVMTHACCPRCRLRFTPAAAAYLVACPECGELPQLTASLERSLGFRLVGPEDLPHELPHALAVSIPIPESGAQP
jgi:hypothetical protein